MIQRITDDLRLAVQKYQKLRGGAFQIESVDFSTWEANTFNDPSINAFVMPGGKIAVLDGIIRVAEYDEDALAVVMGHEFSHELLKHSRNTAITKVGVQAALGVAEKNSGWAQDPDNLRIIGSAVNVGGFLPWSRRHESEADHLGAILATIAGYDIAKGEWLWSKMQSISKNRGNNPEWLSTHPSESTRIGFFRNNVEQIQKEYGKYVAIPLSAIR